MIYVTGDLHANSQKWIQSIHPVLKPGDTVIVAGDFGYGMWRGQRSAENEFYDWIAQQPYTVLFIDGNHENFDLLDALPVDRRNGGSVHKIRPNLMHLLRGEIFFIDGISLFAFGGGYSVDKPFREEGVSWWPREMPDACEYRNAEAKLLAAGNSVDYIVTHTAPSEAIYYLSTIHRFGIQSSVPEEFPLNSFLDTVEKKVTYKHWYFGHLHVDYDLWRNQTAVMNTLRELESGRIVAEWPSYEG